jgi:hypothetical protein
MNAIRSRRHFKIEFTIVSGSRGAMRNTGVYPTCLRDWILSYTEFGLLSSRLRVRNRKSTESIVGSGDANVSLTSFGRRIGTVWKTIETIGLGTVKPRRVILWLDDGAVVADPPPSLRRLQARGLEIGHCRDYGPHKKYYPYVEEILPHEPGRTLVTADDDVYYPPDWLEELLRAHRPGEVTAFRARIRSDAPYKSWPLCDTTDASEKVFATGVSGVAYPPELLHTLRDRGDVFTEVCPRADDYWLHYAAVAAGIPIRQVRDVAAYWWEVVSASNRGLWDGEGTANDAIAQPTQRAWLSDARGAIAPADAMPRSMEPVRRVS